MEPNKRRVYVGICEGKRVESAAPFADCRQLRQQWWIFCTAGTPDPRSKELWVMKERALIEQEAWMRDGPLLLLAREALHPFSRCEELLWPTKEANLLHLLVQKLGLS